MSNFFYWLTNTKWGIFAGCTFIYCIFVLALCIHNHHRETYIESYEEYTTAIHKLLKAKYDITEEEFMMICVQAYCALTHAQMHPIQEVNEDD